MMVAVVIMMPYLIKLTPMLISLQDSSIAETSPAEFQQHEIAHDTRKEYNETKPHWREVGARNVLSGRRSTHQMEGQELADWFTACLIEGLICYAVSCAIKARVVMKARDQGRHSLKMTHSNKRTCHAGV